MSAILDDLGEVLTKVHKDLAKEEAQQCGRPGMAAEQVLRGLLKQAKTIVHVQFTNHNRRTKRRSIKITLTEKLRRYGTLTKRVIQQARRRVLKGETVPNKEKRHHAGRT